MQLFKWTCRLSGVTQLRSCTWPPFILTRQPKSHMALASQRQAVPATNSLQGRLKRKPAGCRACKVSDCLKGVVYSLLAVDIHYIQLMGSEPQLYIGSLRITTTVLHHSLCQLHSYYNLFSPFSYFNKNSFKVI